MLKLFKNKISRVFRHSEVMKLFFLTGILFFSGMAVFAGEIEFTAKVNRTKVGVGENFTITFSMNTTGSDFRGPQLNDFLVLGGPNPSHQIFITNGHISQTVSYTYILQAVKEGKFTIKPATVKIHGKTYSTNELTIEVVKGSTQPAQAQQQPQGHPYYGHPQPQQQQQQQEVDLKKNVFVKASIDKSKTFVGEQIKLTYKIYTSVSIVGLSLTKAPVLNGFWSEVIENNSNSFETHTEVVDGVAYKVAEVRKYILFPQRSGKLEIDPLELECVVRTRSNRRSLNPFFDNYEDVKIKVKNGPVKIEVTSLPEPGKPISFNGAVGSFSLEANIDKSNVKAHEALTYKLTINGKGNLPVFSAPKPNFPEDMEVYDPKTTDRISTTAAGVSGSRGYEYLVIPRHAGNFKIEPVEFSYFDPSTKSYKTLKTGAFEIEVEKSGKEEEMVLSGGRRQEEIKMLADDIRYIKTTLPAFIRSDDFFFGSPLFCFLLVLPLILFGGFVVAWKKQEQINSNPLLLKSRNANKLAVKRLSKSKAFLEQNNLKTFYEEVFKAMYGYISDRLNIPVSELSRERITENLESRNIPKETIHKFNHTVGECEMARFAPVTNVSAQKVYEDALSVIIKIEEGLK